MGFRNPVTTATDPVARSAAAAAQTSANNAQTSANAANTAATNAQTSANAASQAANNITSTQITAGAVTTPALAAGAVQAGNIAAGAVQAGSIAAGAIDGQTITGSTIRTAATGQRVQIDSTSGLVGYNSAGAAVTTVDTTGKLTSTNASVTGSFSALSAGGVGVVLDQHIAGASSGGGLLWKSGLTGGSDGTARDDVLTLNGNPTGRSLLLDAGSIPGYAGTSATVTAQTTSSGSLIQLAADTIKLQGAVSGGDTAWTAATYQNSWTTYAATNIYGPAQFRKLVSGLVVVTGLIAGGTISSTLPAFVLPVGYRPTERLIFAVQSNNALGRVDVDTNGNVYVVTGSNVSVSVCLSFFAG